MSGRPLCTDAVAFAIFNAGYGPDNHDTFARVLVPMAAAAGVAAVTMDGPAGGD